MTNPDRSEHRVTAPPKQTPSMDYFRIVRTLTNVTPAELAAQLARGAPLSTHQRPMPTTEGVSQTLRAVIAWYQKSLGGAATTESPAIERDVGQDELTQEYLTLRSRWEHREAMAVVASLNKCASAQAQATNSVTSQAVSGRYVTTAPSSFVPISLGAVALRAVLGAPGVALSCGIARRRVLLVDDASDVLVTVSAFLESFGFDVIRASSGDAALKALADGPETDLLVTDHAMPGLTGKDLAVQASQICPGLRTLIITGYPDAQDLNHLPSNVMLLAKPFRRAELAERVRQLLANAEAEAAASTPEKKVVYSGA